jgi:zinc protease
MMKRIITFILLSWLLLSAGSLWAKELFGNLQQVNLNNGLKILLLKDTAKPVVATQIWVKVGVWNETPPLNGISHFIEHMLFKGTVTRPVNVLQQEIESKGGFINGATSKDFTYYHIALPSAYWDEAITILADMVQNANFDKLELAKERQVVLEEIKRQNDEPYDYLWNNFNRRLFKKLPYQMSPLGTAQNLNSFTRDMLMQYYRMYYRTEYMTVVIVGDFNEKQVLKRIKQLFPEEPGQILAPLPAAKAPTEPLDSTEPLATELPFSVDLVYHVIGFLGPTVDDSDSYAMDVAATLLGQGQSSRLNQVLHEDKKLVYTVGAGFVSQKANGIFYVDAIYPPNRIPEATAGILGEIGRLSSGAISNEELQKAKTMIETEYILGNQTDADKAATLGYYATLSQVELATQYLERIDKVTKKDVLRTLNKYLTANYTSVLLNPAAQKEK